MPCNQWRLLSREREGVVVNELRPGTARLLDAFLRRKTFIDPVGLKVFRYHHHLHPREAQRVQRREGGPDIGAFFPWAAPAVEYDFAAARLVRDGLLQR